MTSKIQHSPDEGLRRAIEVIMEQVCKPTEPGAAVLVARDGKAIFRKGYGMADLELGVKIEPWMVFRIGSITKQFTAVAILMLAEQGKLSLDDDITAFLPEYPSQGRRITVEHLLMHTSGIRSCTSMPEWFAMCREDKTVQELIDVFKDEPMRFAPGERWEYNNSAYILLGAIIEKTSGETYEQFLDQYVFAPLGMAHSSYDSASRIIPGRVAGYEKSAEGHVNAPYLSMTQPYSAGALLSSVDDLLLWDEALYTEKLLKSETLQRAFTPAVLNDGRPTGYGYGWAVTEYEGHRMIEHSGGINGFLSHAIRIPGEHVFVAVLMNCYTAEDLLAERLAVKVAGETIGHPYREPAAVALAPEALDTYVGAYQIDEEERIVTRDGSRLFFQGIGGRKDEIIPASPTEFFSQKLLARIIFTRNSDGEVTSLEIRDRCGPIRRATRTSKPLPEQ